MKHWDMGKLRQRVNECRDMSDAEKLIYQWVKQDKISPAQMGELLIFAHKIFVFY
jgi:hypothetical protein